MRPEERAGATVNNRFYAFTKHFMERKSRGYHLEATDERIIYVLSSPAHIQPPEGNRILYWKKIVESGQEDWWLVVVIAREVSGLQVLSAYEATDRGNRLWEK